MAPCQATTKAGKPCKAPATAGGLCFFHANPARARELGRIGGRKNRQQLPEPAPTAMTAAELSRLLTEALWDVRSNKLGPRRAAAMSQLAAVLNRTLAVSDLEARVARLEEQMTERVLSVALEVAPAAASVAAPAELCQKASGPNGSATQEKAEATMEDARPSGPDVPEPANQ